MPSFPDPFSGNVPRKITKEELVQALRMDIVGELEAIYLYDAHVMATDDPVVKKVLADIRDEEKAHVGELTALVRYLDPSTDKHLQAGEDEVREMMEELGIGKTATSDDSDATVGSLLDKK